MLKEQKVSKKCIKPPFDLLNPGDVRGIAVVSLLLFLTIVLGACSSDATVTANSGNNSHTATPRLNPTSKTTTATQPTTTAATATQQTTTAYPVKVYFSRLPLSNTNFDAVFPVDRLSPTSNTGTFAMQQLIAGPNAAESTLGYFSEIKDHLVGSSVCSAAATTSGFTLSLNTKGSTSEQGTATLKFCQSFASAGVGTDARAIAEIDATLTQFASIKKVVILTQDSHCFGDESGADVCLH